MSNRSTLSGLAVMLAAAACSPPADQAAAPAVDSAAVIAAAGDLWQRYIAADTSANVTAQMEMIGDSIRIDARGMPPILGKAAWQATLETMRKTTRVTSLSITPDMTIPVSNELVYQNGSYVEQMTTDGKSTMEYGRYATAMRKYPDGQWRFSYVMAFADSTVPVKK